VLPLTPRSRVDRVQKVGLGGVEPPSGPYKEPALTVELQAQRPMGPEGFEPTPCELKARCAAVTPRPRTRVWLRFNRRSRCMLNSFRRSGWSRTIAFAVSERCASVTPPSAVGMVGLEPTVPWSHATWGAAPLHPVSQSERLDLNQRSPGPQPGAIPGFATLCRHRVARVGFEPNLASLKDWQPHQKSNGPCARTLSVSGNTVCFEAGWKALESFSPGLQPGAKPSQLPAHAMKKPSVICVTPGFCELAEA
jgi:hypothetical protein